ncbi:MAG TPA: hypothetical protein VE130_09685 [Nitrososphaeraceae archaeon]|nr:hypothetical protein [Nitrososphaeraceae archaeon]
MGKQVLKGDRISYGFTVVPIATFIMLGVSFIIQNPLFAITDNILQRETQPGINASKVFETHSMTLGNNIKNLVILIPNEAHESTNQPKNQYPLANQPYLPQNAVINVGTTVSWFNGDVDHDHTITVSGDSTNAPVFESGDFEYGTASKPITFNDTGSFNYFETDVNSDDPSFIMNGTITVVNQPESLTSSSTSGSSSIDTVGILMVPTQDIQTHTSDLQNSGFAIDSTHNFKDLRGGQSGTGDEQTLIVWTTSDTTLSNIIANLQEFSLDLPYS